MRFSEIASRLAGISTPIFGVSWTPAQSDVDAVWRTLVFLEDRAVPIDELLDFRRRHTDPQRDGPLPHPERRR